MISINITSNTSHLIVDSSAPSDLKRMYADAMRNRSTARAAEEVVSTLTQLVSELATQSLMDKAVRAAAAGGRSVTDELHAMRDEIAEHSQRAKAEVQDYAAHCAARQAEVAPTLLACMNEQLSIDSTATELKVRIANFENARQRCVERYKEAGLGDEEIARIGLKPTYEDLTLWQRELEQTSRRKVALNDFMRSAPDYDLSLLNGDGAANMLSEV
ncbi:hypothetical protein ACN9MU_04715 [Pseudoduganella sp. R-32]|uniref:hypothetical protein n=1 Tax=Pseudoduganella sp. R-32 TaxID=3404061 RepID=UPI003CF09F26